MPRPRRKRVSRSITASAIRVLDERVRRCERALGFDRRKVGFDATSVVGDRGRAVAREVGLAYGTPLVVRLRRLKEAAADGPSTLTIAKPPSAELPIEDLVQDRIRRFALKRAHEDARKKIPVQVDSSLPLGILHFGDPHLDDDGTDLALVQQHARLVRETPGLFAAHLAIAGHTHESAYGVLKDPDSGITMHGVRVASYKVFDRFAREKGFRDQHLGPACVTVVRPELPQEHPDLVKVFWDPPEGADYLTFLRRRPKAA